MKRIVFSGVVALLIAICSFNVKAQSATSNSEAKDGKVRIEMTIINDNGEVQHINEEYNLGEISEEEIVAKLKSIEGLDLDFDEEDVHVFVERRFAKDKRGFEEGDGKREMKSIAFLGVAGYTTNPDGEAPSEVRLMKVIKDKPAYMAGLRNEDILMSFDGKNLKTYEDLVEAIKAKKPGDQVDVKIRREGKEQRYSVTLGERKVPKHAENRLEHFFPEKRFRVMEFVVETQTTGEDEKVIVKKSRSQGLKNDDKDTFEDVDLSIFPNPANGKFEYTLKLSSADDLIVRVLDTSGKEILRETVKSKNGEFKGTLNLEKSPTGTYLLLFKQGDKILSEKLIKS